MFLDNLQWCHGCSHFVVNDFCTKFRGKKIAWKCTLNKKIENNFFLRWHGLGHVNRLFPARSCRDNSVGGHWKPAGFQCPQTSSNVRSLPTRILFYYSILNLHVWKSEGNLGKLSLNKRQLVRIQVVFLRYIYPLQRLANTR